ncbi:MAG: hypothetical protein K8L97_11165 [Anaerolineae bacterium]|nr:hypothetical protein [Anaerolineae bacterium]
MRKCLLCLIGLIALAITACGTGGETIPGASAPGNLIEWDRNPNTIVFRADVTGGSSTDPFLAASEIPACTIYGDNHVVWTNELGAFNTQVLEDRLTDDQMRTFVNFLVLNRQIYNYKARTDVAPASSTAPVVETLLLFVNNVPHETDAFSGWDGQYYQEVVQSCRSISTAPALYVPAAAWITARVVEYDPSATALLWDAAANGLDLAALAAEGNPRWITDRNVAVIWNILRTSPPNIQFNQDNLQYWVSVQAPNITRESPPAPSGS